METEAERYSESNINNQMMLPWIGFNLDRVGGHGPNDTVSKNLTSTTAACCGLHVT